MKHLALIQTEFLQNTKRDYLWDDMSYSAQRQYLHDHPKSKRHITRHRDDDGKSLMDIEIPRSTNALAEVYNIPKDFTKENLLPNNTYGFLIYENQYEPFAKRWLDIVNKYNLRNLMFEYNQHGTNNERKLEIKDEFQKAIGGFEDTFTVDEATRILEQFGKRINPSIGRRLKYVKEGEAIKLLKQIGRASGKTAKKAITDSVVDAIKHQVPNVPIYAYIIYQGLHHLFPH